MTNLPIELQVFHAPPPSLKAQALEALDDIEREIKPYIQHFDLPYMQGDIKTVRAALEALND